MRFAAAMFALTLSAASAQSALAQTIQTPLAGGQSDRSSQPSTDTPPCEGAIVVVRLSEITENGSIDKFMAAAAAQQAWYRSHGSMSNQIVVARISIRDPQTHAYTYSNKEVLSYHINPPTQNIPHDDAYNAFVKLYNDTSHIKETWTTCMPKTMIVSGN